MIFLILSAPYLMLALLVWGYIDDKLWFKWIEHSVRYRWHLRNFKLNLNTLNENEKTLHLVEFISSDFWFNRFWFGRKLRKFAIDELKKIRDEKPSFDSIDFTSS